MIRRRLGALMLAVATALALVSCASAPAPSPKGRVVVPLNADKTFATVSVPLAHELVLQLPPVELPGYRWKLFLHDPRFLKQLSEATTPADLNSSGTLSFLALRLTSGRQTRVRVMLVQSDAKREDEPIAGYEVAIRIEPPAAPETKGELSP